MRIYVYSVGKERSEFEPMELEYARRMPYRMEIRSFENESRLLRAIPQGVRTILLSEHGTQPGSSEDFARWLQRKLNSGVKGLAFVVAGSYGPGPELKAAADEVLSLSNLTFPHRIARLLVVEQLYRAVSILQGSPYHH